MTARGTSHRNYVNIPLVLGEHITSTLVLFTLKILVPFYSFIYIYLKYAQLLHINEKAIIVHGFIQYIGTALLYYMTPPAGASFEGAGAVALPPRKRKKKKRKKKKKKKEKKKNKKRRKMGTMNNVKLLHTYSLKCCFFQFSNSPVALKNK